MTKENQYKQAYNIIANAILDTKKSIKGQKGIKKILSITLDALQKQVPLTPQEDTSTECTARIYLCPSCGKYLYKGGRKKEYCSRCGQALDWTEQNRRDD